MPIIITVIARGINFVDANLKGNIERSRDLTIPMKQGAVLMMGSIAENFQIGGRPINWVPLSPKYLARKVSMGYSSIPLTKTGYLKASIVPEVNSMGFKLGTSVPYARIHQKGGYAGRKRSAFIPARPYLVFQQTDVERVNQLVTEYITKGI